MENQDIYQEIRERIMKERNPSKILGEYAPKFNMGIMELMGHVSMYSSSQERLAENLED